MKGWIILQEPELERFTTNRRIFNYQFPFLHSNAKADYIPFLILLSFLSLWLCL